MSPRIVPGLMAGTVSLGILVAPSRSEMLIIFGATMECRELIAYDQFKSFTLCLSFFYKRYDPQPFNQKSWQPLILIIKTR